MIEVLKQFLRPKPILAIVVTGCATWALTEGRLSGSEWVMAVGAAMWWTNKTEAAK
ncbi:hypothetical protein [Comamonas sp. SCN 65-56]|uniref:hypothetical protein n=1 Tax=Comamonas sp. SCN 65-56 TaxID=1660095 RepID=UPI0025C44ED7|nr:hypothetical protein [Comamonas sp. SCN 65-56]